MSKQTRGDRTAMEHVKRVSLIGLGAIGAAVASKIFDSDPERVNVIVDQERMRRYQTEGVVVNGKNYPFSYVTPESETEPADLILVAVKHDALQQAIRDIRRHVGTDTVILSLMNGIASEELIGAVYGDDRMLYAMSVAIDAVRSGREIRFSNIGRICFGEANNAVPSNKVKRVAQFFNEVNVPYEIPENMLRAMWWKFMINVGINQTSAVLKAPYGVFQSIPEAYEAMRSAMYEVIRLSDKTGIHLNDQDFETFDGILRQLSPEGKTSMLQDIEAGRKTEVEYMAGTVCELGRKHGVETPINQMLLQMIRTLEQMNS